jgi:hypothetical protein
MSAGLGKGKMSLTRNPAVFPSVSFNQQQVEAMWKHVLSSEY